MKRISIFILIIVLLQYCTNIHSKNFDVTIVGPMIFADGLGRLSIGFIDHLHNDLKINFIGTRVEFKHVPFRVQKIVTDSDKSAGNVSILFDQIWSSAYTRAELVPDSKIKIAYSMIESNAIPIQWVKILNEKFDLVAVPDKFLQDVFKNSGVKIPVFVMPHGIYIEEFLSEPLKEKANDIFTFGMSAGFNSSHKNHELLIEAFAKEFGNNSSVKLRVHGRIGSPELQERVLKKIKSLKQNNIEFLNKSFTRDEYFEFMKTLDCFVLPSKGEGFSVTPREALALGLPCILSNNSAHKTICETGLVRSVEAPLKSLAYYLPFNSFCGYNFNCKVEALMEALRDVYENYNVYLKRAHEGREWVKQYLYANLKKKYLNLVKPTKVILDSYNKIEDDCLITNCPRLYEKYHELIKQNP